MTDQVNTTEITPETTETPTVFGKSAPETPEVTPALSIPTELSDLIGEGKKYKDLNAALASIPHAQEHIKSVETSLKELREDLAKRATAEELLDQLEKKSKEKSPDAPPISIQDLEGLVSKTLASTVAKQQQEKNILSVDAEIRKVYGEKSEEAVANKAKELGLSIKEMEGLAAKSPQAFLAFFKTPDMQPSADKTSTLNTEGLVPKSDEKNFAYYQKVRKENPTAYYSPSFQQEMHRRAKELGSKFYT